MEHTTRNRHAGARIKAIRKSKGLTALQLAHKVGITENAIRKLESGDSKEPRFSTALRIARALNVEPDFISKRSSEHGYPNALPELACVIRQIRDCRLLLNQRGVKQVRVFGSVARGDARPTSDVDIIIEPATTERFTLLDLATARDILTDALHRHVDAITENTLRRSNFYEIADHEAVSVF